MIDNQSKWVSQNPEKLCTFIPAYPSLKLLGSWTRDLMARMDHFTTWAVTTHPPMLFWLAAYTFPTGFLTAVLQVLLVHNFDQKLHKFNTIQTAARQNEVPIDSLNWEFTVLSVDENSIQQSPESGVYVRGTFLEGAGWDRKNAILIEPQPMQLVSAMPLIHFKPVEQIKKKAKGMPPFFTIGSAH